jgi:hypothetical protein
MVLGFASMLTAYVVWLTWNEGQDLPKRPANKPAKVNAFMKQTGEKPFIYQPRDDVYVVIPLNEVR